MANLILTWSAYKDHGNRRAMAPSAYYMDTDYVPIAVRLYAEFTPEIEDAEFNIYDDGVTLLTDRATKKFRVLTGRFEADPEVNVAISVGENTEVSTGDLKDTIIEEGSWVSCNIIKDGGGRNFTVQLELEPIGEPL